ncbi:MAG: hypothetical protein ACM31E_03300 [Fibrobacterota bacterium]
MIEDNMYVTEFPELPFSCYIGGHFEYLLKEPFAEEIWTYFTKKENLQLMFDAINEKKPPLWYHLEYIEVHFCRYIESDDFPGDDVEVMINNMIKQIMEKFGYEHIACGMLRHAKYIKLSGVYKKRE